MIYKEEEKIVTWGAKNIGRMVKSLLSTSKTTN